MVTFGAPSSDEESEESDDDDDEDDAKRLLRFLLRFREGAGFSGAMSVDIKNDSQTEAMSIKVKRHVTEITFL